MTPSCQSHLPSYPGDCPEEDWEGRCTIFWRWTFPSRMYLQFATYKIKVPTEKKCLPLLCGGDCLFFTKLSCTVLLPIEYLWLRLLANVTELWKMQTVGKTGWKNPKELLHDSAALSYQEAQTGNTSKKGTQQLQSFYVNLSPLLLLHVCIAGELLLQLADIAVAVCLISSFNRRVNSTLWK